MVQLVLTSYRNSNIFSNHFLQNRVINLEEWKQDLNVEKVFNKIKEIYKDQKELLKKYNEHQLEDNFIKPIFKELGHFFEVQETTDKSARRPDYAFFPSEEEKRSAIKNKGKIDFYKTAIAIGDAKQWGISLDKKIKGKDTFEFQNPSFQIDSYLRETKPKWGILTNGRKWRIYYKETSYKLDSYYEIDLINIIENEKLNDFKYFYFFFRREAFIEDSTGKSFLDKVFNQSIKYAEDIGENLEESVYKALKWMAEGFLSLKSNNLSKDEETIEKIHENSLIFLYRLLFILYANSRGILKPPKDRRYDPYDIEALIEEIIYKLDRNEVPHGAWYWTRLEEISLLVNQGSVARNIPKEEFFVPAYNGGLFDPEKHPFLKEKKINDEYIAKVIDLLVRTRSKNHEGFARVDYSDLSIRHLGGIYEGLLEYKLKIAQEDLVAIKIKEKIIWIQQSKVKNEKIYDEVKKGEIYLVTDRGERKVTGSYYTPDYIVKHIVENSLGSILEEKIKGLKNNEEIKEAILSIKILDPAMGSGHFLVEATDILAQKLSLYIETEEGKDADIEWAKREIVKRCIYGVDLNPLAVELAKVSLWLDTISKDRPLSFLDHHLRVGNSLIGIDIKELGKHPEDKNQNKNNLLRFFGTDFNKRINDLLNLYKDIMKIRGEDVDDIRKQEEIYYKLKNNSFRVRFEELANLYTSYYFGNKFSEEEYKKVLNEVKLGGNWNKITQLDILKKALIIAKEKNFFHWKLEFLEVFFDIETGEKSNPGFDVIIGNPPYVNAKKEKFTESEKDFFYKNYQTAQYQIDTYILFLERGKYILKEGGTMSYIVPNAWLNNLFLSKVRFFMLSNFQFNEIVNTPIGVFPDATVDTIIFNVSNKNYKNNNVIISQVENQKIKFTHKTNQMIFLKNENYNIDLFSGNEIKQIISKIEENSIKLESICDMSSGIKEYETGKGTPSQIKEDKIRQKFNAKFKKDNTFLPHIKGRDLKNYVVDWQGEYLSYGEWLAAPRKKKYFEGERLIIREIPGKNKLIVSYTDDIFTVKNSAHICLPKNKNFNIFFLLSMLNSKLIGFYFKYKYSEFDAVFPKAKLGQCKKLPIKIININDQLKIKEFALKIIEESSKLQKIRSNFLDYLKTKFSIEELSKKMLNWFELDFKDFVNELIKNKIKLSLSEEAEWMRYFNDQKEKVKEIKIKINETDKEINDLVNKFYGITESEKKIIEESLK